MNWFKRLCKPRAPEHELGCAPVNRVLMSPALAPFAKEIEAERKRMAAAYAATTPGAFDRLRAEVEEGLKKADWIFQPPPYKHHPEEVAMSIELSIGTSSEPAPDAPGFYTALAWKNKDTLRFNARATAATKERAEAFALRNLADFILELHPREPVPVEPGPVEVDNIAITWQVQSPPYKPYPEEFDVPDSISKAFDGGGPHMCKGSKVLGTACGACPRCWTVPGYAEIWASKTGGTPWKLVGTFPIRDGKVALSHEARLISDEFGAHVIFGPEGVDALSLVERMGPHGVPVLESEAAPTPRPPLGIKPQSYWLEERIIELARALVRAHDHSPSTFNRSYLAEIVQHSLGLQRDEESPERIRELTSALALLGYELGDDGLPRRKED